jgi:hypothetical protein
MTLDSATTHGSKETLEPEDAPARRKPLLYHNIPQRRSFRKMALTPAVSYFWKEALEEGDTLARP